MPAPARETEDETGQTGGTAVHRARGTMKPGHLTMILAAAAGMNLMTAIMMTPMTNAPNLKRQLPRRAAGKGVAVVMTAGVSTRSSPHLESTWWRRW